MSTGRFSKRSLKRAYVIAHGDLDGLTAAATIVSALSTLGYRASVRIAFPHTLDQVLASLGEVEKVIIVDIAVDDAALPRVKACIARLVRGGAEVTWIDHHQSTKDREDELRALGVKLVWAPEFSVAPLVRREFLARSEDPALFDKLLSLGEAFDRAQHIKPGLPLAEVLESLSLALELDPLDEDFRLRLVKMWTTAKQLIDDEVALRAEEAYEIFAKLLRQAEERIVYSSEEAVVIDMVGVRVRGFTGRLAAHIAESAGRVCFVVIKAGRQEIVVTCRVPKGRKLNAHEIVRRIAADLGGSGGGHKGAASVRLPLHMHERVLSYLKRLCERGLAALQ